MILVFGAVISSITNLDHLTTSLIMAFVVVMEYVIPIIFLADGLRRTNKALREGESISSTFIALIIVAFSIGIIYAIFDLVLYYIQLEKPTSIIIINLSAGTLNVTSVLFLAILFDKIGTQQRFDRSRPIGSMI